MKKIYLAVFATLILSAVLFAVSFLYIDKEKHKTFFYNVNVDGHDIGNIKIDKYITDDKTIYKSVDLEPFGLLFTEIKSRITLNKNGELVSYSKESIGNGAQDTVYIENSNDNISFVSTSEAEFACLTDFGIKKGSLVFEERSPVTYMPILEKYDFSLGRSQAFNVLTSFSTLLPPMKRLVTLTYVKDEFIKISSRKIKVECLLIKIRNAPQGTIWVTKSTKSIVKIEFPGKKLKITRTFYPKKVNEIHKIINDNEKYNEETVKFNNKKISLEGTLTMPKGNGPFPAILLLSHTNCSDRENEGLSTQIASQLGGEGFAVLRFDNRGIGNSSGNASSSTSNDHYEDSLAALDYLSQRKDVDPDRIAVIGHGEGAFFAVKLALDKKNIRTLVLMSPMLSMGGASDISFDNLEEMAKKLKWDEQYSKLAMKSRMEILEKLKNNKGDWISIIGTRCFLKKLREDMDTGSVDIIRKVEIPVLILHGKEDELVPAKTVMTLDKALEDSGNINHKLIHYGYLGHFLGKTVTDGIHKTYYSIDENVISAIKKWLDDNVSKIDLTLQKSYDILPVNNKKEGGE